MSLHKYTRNVTNNLINHILNNKNTKLDILCLLFVLEFKKLCFKITFCLIQTMHLIVPYFFIVFYILGTINLIHKIFLSAKHLFL